MSAAMDRQTSLVFLSSGGAREASARASEPYQSTRMSRASPCIREDCSPVSEFRRTDESGEARTDPTPGEACVLRIGKRDMN